MTVTSGDVEPGARSRDLRSLFPQGSSRWILAAIVVIALILDFLFYTGFFASDDIGYFHGAGWFVGDPGDGKLLLTGDIRIGVTLPSALIYWLSDGDVGWIAWFHVLYHLALVVLAFSLGNLLKGERVGLIAAFLVATSPLYYLFAGAILPDNPTALWVGLTLFALEYTRQNPDLPVRSRRLWYLAMGVFLGFGYTCNEKSLVFCIPVAVSIMAAAPRLRSWSWVRAGALVIVGLVSVMLLEVVVLRAVTGEWIWRLGILQGYGDMYEQRMGWQGATPMDRLYYAYARRLVPVIPLTVWVFAFGSVAYMFVRRRSWTMLLFFWWPLLYITIGSTSFADYRPPTLQTRYYSLVVVPAAVMVATVLMVALSRWSQWSRVPSRARRPWVVATAVSVALMAIAYKEFVINVPRSGNLYKSSVVRGFVAAYEKARAEYPHYPIVLSNYYKKKMTPLLEPKAPKHVYAASYLTGKGKPPLPYVYLESVERLKAPIDGVVNDRREGRVMRRTLHLVEPPPNRIAALIHAAEHALGVQPRDPLLSPERGRAVIQLVTRADDYAGETLPVRAPLAPFMVDPQDVRIRWVDDGYVVVWTDTDPMTVQFPDDRTYKRPPAQASMKLEPVDGLSVDFDLHLLRGQAADVRVSLFGYSKSGQWSLERRALKVRPGEAQTPVSLHLETGEAIHSYKLRVEVKQGRPSDGALFISKLRLRGS